MTGLGVVVLVGVVVGVRDRAQADQPDRLTLEQLGVQRLEAQAHVLAGLDVHLDAVLLRALRGRASGGSGSPPAPCGRAGPGTRTGSALPGLLVDQVAFGDQLAEAAEAVALLVLGIVGGQDAQLGAGLRVEQEQDAVEVAERLAGQLLAEVGQFADVLGAYALLAQSGQDLARDQLDAQAQSVTQFAGDADRVLGGLADELREGVLAALLRRAQ